MDEYNQFFNEWLQNLEADTEMNIILNNNNIGHE